MGDRERSGLGDVNRGRVDHHRQVEVGERAGFEQLDLAAATLLGGSAVDPHRDAEIVGQPGERETGTDSAGGDQVVSARMPEARQGVVLGHDADRGRPAARLGEERRRKAEIARSDREAAGTQRVADPAGGAMLLPRRLGVAVQRLGQPDQARRRCGDDRVGDGLQGVGPLTHRRVRRRWAPPTG